MENVRIALLYEDQYPSGWYFQEEISPNGCVAGAWSDGTVSGWKSEDGGEGNGKYQGIHLSYCGIT